MAKIEDTTQDTELLDNVVLADTPDDDVYEPEIITEEDAQEKKRIIAKIKKKHPEYTEEELESAYKKEKLEQIRKEKEKERKREAFWSKLKCSAKYLTMILTMLLLLLFMSTVIYDSIIYDNIDPEYMNFSEFIEKIENKEVYAIYSYDKDTMRFKLIADVPEEFRTGDKASYSLLEIGQDNWYETQNTVYEDFSELVAKNNVPIITGKFTKATTKLLATFLNVITLIFPFSILILLMCMMLFPTGMKNDKVTITQSSNVRFKDIIGHSEVIEDLKLYVDLLKKPGAARKLGVAIPKGMIFNGPPGTGKTLIAKALAGEAGVPFLYINASNVIELYVGMGARTIRSAFKKARSMSPCVVFIDEIDAIGGKRGRWGTSSEDTQTINALLQELDGFNELNNILVIAATNNMSSLDSALLRSGRFDRKLEILPPKDKITRKDMLKLYTSKLALEPSLKLDKVAEQTSGFTGADIKVLCNEAALIALQKEQDVVTQDNFNEAIDQMMLKGNRVKDKSNINLEDMELVAYHEAGHAVMCYLQDMPITRASIQSSTSGVGGFVIPADNDSLFTTKTDMLKMLKVAYAGRASESIKQGEDAVTNGASNDIQKATQIIQGYIMQYGFNAEMGMLDFKTLLENNICDNKTLLEEMKRVSKECYADVKKELSENYALVESVAKALLEREVLSGDEFTHIIEETKQQGGKVAL